MGRAKTYISILIILTICLGLAACGSSEVSGYRIIANLGTDNFSIAFRQDDKLQSVVTSALSVLAADGTITQMSQQWFGTDISTVEGNPKALDELDFEISERVFIMGIDLYSYPMCYKESSGDYTGFDVELAKKVCDLLGWELKIQPISPSDVAVELASGNIDCAWGGMSFPQSPDGYSASSPYLKNNQVILVRADSGIRNMRRLKNKVLYMPDSDAAASALEAEVDLSKNLSKATRLSGDSLACLKYLNEGRCDAIIIDSAAAKNLMK